MTEKSQDVFQGRENVALMCYSFIINTFGVLNRMLDNVMDLDVYYEEIDKVGGQGHLLVFLRR